MGKKVTEYSQIVRILSDLKKEYPRCTIGQHLYLILEEYKHFESLWNMTDREFLFALEKHQATCLLQNPITPRINMQLASDEEIDLIIRDAQHLDTLFDEEEEDNDY